MIKQSSFTEDICTDMLTAIKSSSDIVASIFFLATATSIRRHSLQLRNPGGQSINKHTGGGAGSKV